MGNELAPVVEPLTPALKAVTFDLPADVASTNAGEAGTVLGQLSSGIRLASAAAVYYRILLGRQLSIIRDKGLWRDNKLSAAYLGADPPRNWDAWTREHLEPLFGLSRETAYGAMQIANCKAIASLEEPDLRSFEILSNAILLARIERQEGEAVALRLLPKAMELSLRTFRGIAGLQEDGMTQTTTVTSPRVAQALDAIGRRLKDADNGTLDAIAGLLDGEVASLCGDNPTDIASFVLASLQHEIGAQIAEE